MNDFYRKLQRGGPFAFQQQQHYKITDLSIYTISVIQCDFYRFIVYFIHDIIPLLHINESFQSLIQLFIDKDNDTNLCVLMRREY